MSYVVRKKLKKKFIKNENRNRMPSINVYTKNDNGHYVCPQCNIVKEKQNTMFYHYETHKGKLKYVCDICDYDCSQKRSLELHKIAKHSNNKNETDKKKYKCVFPNCDFESLTKANRRIHCVRKHFKKEVDSITGENNECTNCNNTFLSNTAFLYHAIDCMTITAEYKKYIDAII